MCSFISDIERLQVKFTSTILFVHVLEKGFGEKSSFIMPKVKQNRILYTCRQVEPQSFTADMIANARLLLGFKAFVQGFAGILEIRADSSLNEHFVAGFKCFNE